MSTMVRRASTGIRPCAYQAIMAGDAEGAVRIKSEIRRFEAELCFRSEWISNDYNHAKFMIGQLRSQGRHDEADQAQAALEAFCRA